MSRITLSSDVRAKLVNAGFVKEVTPATVAKKAKDPSYGSARHHSLLWQAVATASEELDSLGWSPEEARGLVGREASTYFQAKTKLEEAQAKLRNM